MHEIYLIRNTFERIEEEFPEKSDRVSEIHLKVGLLSNVQPILIQNAFKAREHKVCCQRYGDSGPRIQVKH